MGYVFASGKTIHFIGGIYATESEVEIKELIECCKSGNPCFYIDAEQTTVDSEMLDPIAQLTAKIRAQVLAEIVAASDPTNDRGETKQGGKLEGIANSSTMQGLQANSNGGATVAAGSIKVATATATKL